MKRKKNRECSVEENEDPETNNEVESIENENTNDEGINTESGQLEVEHDEHEFEDSKLKDQDQALKQPYFDFTDNYPNQKTHMIKILSTQNRWIPVPIGPAIPRRGREENKERYSRLMLQKHSIIFFQNAHQK